MAESPLPIPHHHKSWKLLFLCIYAAELPHQYNEFQNTCISTESETFYLKQNAEHM